MIKFFPLEKPRKAQEQVIEAIYKAFQDGYINVILESPVGSGKSATAVTLAKAIGSTHLLTPRKALQDQYIEDFSHEDLSSMKGRSSYPCTYLSNSNPSYQVVVDTIKKKQLLTKELLKATYNCSNGPCISGGSSVRIKCEGERKQFPCPYVVAFKVAEPKQMIVHNFHSFIFQTMYGDKWDQRELLVVDEAHEIEGIIREFAKRSISIPKLIPESERPSKEEPIDNWVEWFKSFSDLFSEKAKPGEDVSDREQFLVNLNNLSFFSSMYGNQFVLSVEEDSSRGREKTKFTFIPIPVGAVANNLLFKFGKKRLLMSGTIYSKGIFCNSLGLKEEETCFIKIGSSFPVKNRPIYAKKEYMVDTSHAGWDENFKEMVAKIKTIMEVFKDAKGLIHTPSYKASIELQHALKDTGRIAWHEAKDFEVQLNRFYNDPDPKVFLSPICQQGVDFKNDRARFQIILRVPNLNTGDDFVNYQVQNNFQWYNYQSLVTFGQQIGRVVRSETDFGVTVLMDERFIKFISRNRGILPKWLLDSIIYK